MKGSSCFRRCHCRCICKRNLIISCFGSYEFCCCSISCITAIQFIACLVILSRISFSNCICPSCWQTTNVYGFIFCQGKRSLIICKGEILYFIISFFYENLPSRYSSGTCISDGGTTFIVNSYDLFGSILYPVTVLLTVKTAGL